jgi:hypothetical protein
MISRALKMSLCDPFKGPSPLCDRETTSFAIGRPVHLVVYEQSDV